jgi:hypothetical protein
MRPGNSPSGRTKNRGTVKGVFRSIVELQAAINRFLTETNADPKPFVCTLTPIASLLPCSARSKC